MEWRKNLLREIGVVAVGQLVCVAAMMGVYALLGRFDWKVLYSGLLGGLIALVNHLLLVVFANIAADKAESQDVTGGQKLVHLSYAGRMIGLFVVLLVCVKSGWFSLLPLVLPLTFTRPALSVYELIIKKKDLLIKVKSKF